MVVSTASPDLEALSKLSTSQKQALLGALQREKAKRDFVYFLTFCKVRSDDPLHPTVTDWEPWDYLVEQAKAWASGESEIVLKDRQLGYSWLFAAYAVWRAKWGANVALISKGQLEARELLSKCAFIETHLPAFLQDGKRCVIRVDDIKYSSTDGMVMAFPSTPDAGVSFTFQVVGMDEAHFHPYAAQNFGSIQPTLSAGGQFVALSTSDPSMGGYGWFADMYWSSKRGETGYTARFVPWSARPGRDLAWLEKQRRAYTGLPEHFDAYYADTDAQAFAGKSGLVFPMFSEERHVKRVGDVIRGGQRIVPLDQCVRVVAGVDLGGGDPTVISILGMDSSHHIHKYDELYRRGPVPVDDLAQFLVQFPMLDAIECPPEQATVIATLKQSYGLPAHAANNKRADGLNLFASVLEADEFTFDADHCQESIAEFPGYRWAERTDPNDKTRYATKTPVDHHADGKDSERYGLMEILAFMHDPGVKLTRLTTAGRPLARKAS